MFDKFTAIDIYWTWPFLVLIGVFVTLIGFKVIKATPKPHVPKEKFEKGIANLKWMGPFIAFLGILKAFQVL